MGAADRRDLAARGEELAARRLVALGYEIVARNFTCPVGEADIVAREGKTLVFVEVKTRRSRGFGLPEEAVDWRKRAKLRQVARWYLGAHRCGEVPVRFDVVAVVLREGEEEIRVIPGAFDGEGLPSGQW